MLEIKNWQKGKVGKKIQVTTSITERTLLVAEKGPCGCRWGGGGETAVPKKNNEEPKHKK